MSHRGRAWLSVVILSLGSLLRLPRTDLQTCTRLHSGADSHRGEGYDVHRHGTTLLGVLLPCGGIVFRAVAPFDGQVLLVGDVLVLTGAMGTLLNSRRGR